MVHDGPGYAPQVGASPCASGDQTDDGELDVATGRRAPFDDDPDAERWHDVLLRRGSVLAPAAPLIRHTGKDGFFLGRLEGGGDGIVTWVADPSKDSEAAPHPYVVSIWRWEGDHFGKPSSYETTRSYLASDTDVVRSNVVARAIRLPYRDQTATRSFMEPGVVMERLNALEEEATK